MFKVFAAFAGIAWALAGFRNLPPLEHQSGAAVGVVVLVMVLAAFFAGSRFRADAANASALARAEATALAAVSAETTSTAAASVNLYVGTPGLGAQRAARYDGLDSAPWMVGAERRAEVEDSDAYQTAMADVLDVQDVT